MQKEFIDLLGRLSGKPATSGIHIHPLLEGKRDVGINDAGDVDDHISVISSKLSRKLHLASRYTFASKGWHSEYFPQFFEHSKANPASMTFEHVPSDYAILKMRKVPPTGGDTIWASGYEMYDRLSAPYQRFLEGLTAKHANPDFQAAAARVGFEIHPGPRGAAENVGQDLIANHPVVRTNPVTGWKSIYGALNQIEQLNELAPQESEEVLRYLGQLLTNNHDLQCRFKWGVDDVAIVSFPHPRRYVWTMLISGCYSGIIGARSIRALLMLMLPTRERGIGQSVWVRFRIWIQCRRRGEKLLGKLSRDVC